MSHTGCCNRPWWKSSASVCWSICYPGRTKHNTYHQIHFPGILWHLRWPDLRDLLTRSYSCVHICSSLYVMGVNPFTDSFLTFKKKKCDWLPKAEVTFEVQQRRLSRLLIHMCSGRGKVYKKRLFFQPGYEMVTFAGVVWGWERGRHCRYWSGGWMMSLTC